MAAAATSELERSLSAFTEFTEPAVPSAPLPPPPAALDAFTELELEAGDSLLHAVELAAAAGLAQRGAGPVAVAPSAAVVEEAMEALPDEARSGTLPRIPLFSDLPEDAFIALFDRCPLRRFEPGQEVISQGTVGTAFYVICAGAVRVRREDQGRVRELATLEEGAFFGEMALLSDAPRSASVEASGEDTQLLEISAQVLAELSGKHPTVATALKKFCRQRLLQNLMNASPLFEPFSRSDRRTLVERFRAREVKPGDVVIRAGQRSDGMYLVLTGEILVEVDGRRVAALKEGDLFGEMSLLTKSPATANCVASRHTSLLRLPREDFDQLISSHPQILVLVSELTDERNKKNTATASRESPRPGGAPMI